MARALACSNSAGSSSWSRLRCQRRRASPATSSPRTDATWSTRSRFLTGAPSLARVPGYAAASVPEQPGAEVAARIPPHRMDVVGAVLAVVELDQEARPVEAVVVGSAGGRGRRAGPREGESRQVLVELDEQGLGQ